MTTSYPTSVTRSSRTGRKILGLRLSPAGHEQVYDLSRYHPRSDFEQDGFHCTLTDLLQQELPEYESRPHGDRIVGE